MSTTNEPSLDLTLRRLKAIADGKRLQILTLLSEGERCVCELQDALEAGQSLLSHHLRALKEAGLVSDRREGRWVYYALNREAVGELEEFLRAIRTSEAPLLRPPVCCA